MPGRERRAGYLRAAKGAHIGSIIPYAARFAKGKVKRGENNFPNSVDFGQKRAKRLPFVPQLRHIGPKTFGAQLAAQRLVAPRRDGERLVKLLP